MKKLLLFFCAILFSCSGDDTSSSSGRQSCINPPDWLQGAWVKYEANDETEIDSKIVVSDDNIIVIDPSTSEVDFAELYCDKEPTITTEENLQSTYYSFRYTIHSNGVDSYLTFYFEKVGDGSISYGNSLGMDNEYVKE